MSLIKDLFTSDSPPALPISPCLLFLILRDLDVLGSFHLREAFPRSFALLDLARG